MSELVVAARTRATDHRNSLNALGYFTAQDAWLLDQLAARIEALEKAAEPVLASAHTEAMTVAADASVGIVITGAQFRALARAVKGDGE